MSDPSWWLCLALIAPVLGLLWQVTLTEETISLGGVTFYAVIIIVAVGGAEVTSALVARFRTE